MLDNLKENLQALRQLDFDDFAILTLLTEKVQNSVISKYLRVTPPAVSHRILKYEKVFGTEIFTKVSGKKELSEKGLEIFTGYKKMFCQLLNLPEDFECSKLFEL